MYYRCNVMLHQHYFNCTPNSITGRCIEVFFKFNQFLFQSACREWSSGGSSANGNLLYGGQNLRSPLYSQRVSPAGCHVAVSEV